ncbi:RNA polymerase sigma-70 factor [Chitinophaga eiseniae]|uniref:RNA polymerase sigma-70 factor n=2 Tax=Chitinophaga eiseniae TaxID=634771 RepID=A0A847SK65_9BACT|nr:RNA polymerase sigma-70 factor [Chitinophaga eiseniae]
MEQSHDKLVSLVEHYFHTYYESLHRYAFTILKDNDQAKDAVQAVFLKLWEKRSTIDEEQSVKSYLYTAVYNYCLNVKRHDKIRDRYTTESNAIGYEEGNQLVGKEVNQRIMGEITALPPQCQLIFTKSRFEGKKYATIAAEMNLSVKTVEAQMGKALKILREKLGDLIVILVIIFS